MGEWNKTGNVAVICKDTEGKVVAEKVVKKELYNCTVETLLIQKQCTLQAKQAAEKAAHKLEWACKAEETTQKAQEKLATNPVALTKCQMDMMKNASTPCQEALHAGRVVKFKTPQRKGE